MPHLSRFALPKRARKVPRPAQPDHIRMAYFASMRPFLREMRAEVARRVRPVLRELVARHRTAARHDAKPGARASTLVQATAHAMTKKWPNERLAALGRTAAEATSKFQKDQLFKQVRSALGVPLATVADKGVAARLAQFTSENVSLIRTVQTRYLADVELTIQRGLSTGARAEDIAAELTDRFEVAESNALRIARDQVGKLNGQLNAVRQQQIGISGFIWRTMKDGKVREEHADLNGESFSYDDPPDEGLPGEPINCRCYAEPDLAGVLEDG